MEERGRGTESERVKVRMSHAFEHEEDGKEYQLDGFTTPQLTSEFGTHIVTTIIQQRQNR
jgi:hypothetical protein